MECYFGNSISPLLTQHDLPQQWIKNWKKELRQPLSYTRDIGYPLIINFISISKSCNRDHLIFSTVRWWARWCCWVGFTGFSNSVWCHLVQQVLDWVVVEHHFWFLSTVTVIAVFAHNLGQQPLLSWSILLSSLSWLVGIENSNTIPGSHLSLLHWQTILWMLWWLLSWLLWFLLWWHSEDHGSWLRLDTLPSPILSLQSYSKHQDGNVLQRYVLR